MAIIFSDLTPYDRAVLEPSLHFFFDKNNCDIKAEQLEKRLSISKKEATERVRLGCAVHKKHGETEDFEYWVCPCQIVDRSMGILLSLALRLKKGILPFEGGYLDQPANLMAALGIVESFLQRQEERERKATEAKQMKGKR
jgi:hypothetical protein